MKNRLGSDEASKKLAARDVWKSPAGEMIFENLTSRHRGVEAMANGYALLEKFVQKTHELRPIMSHEAAACCRKSLLISTRSHTLHTLKLYAKSENAAFPHRTQATSALLVTSFRKATWFAFYLDAGSQQYPDLRPQGDGSYKLTTFTYTHDVMEGEFLKRQSFREEKQLLLQ